jgi:hypothetical protein
LNDIIWKGKHTMLPPSLPIEFNSRYELQIDRVAFCRKEGWARGVGNERTLHLLAMEDAPYSTPEERLANPNPARIEQAITYLFTDELGELTEKGIRRYRPTTNATYCNIFVNDVTRIFHAEIPNNPANTSVGQMQKWLSDRGKANGWTEHDEEAGQEAQQWVNAGHIAIMIWSKRIASDHIALVRPGDGQGDTNGLYFPRIAQAGSIVSADLDSQKSFGDLSKKSLRFYFHD